MNNPISVRFAPSPTGALHIGGARTVLYNYLLAKKEGGRFVLRIEDTDQKRFMSGAEDYILESLRWLDIMPDEDPEQGGSFGPYKQSERLSIYKTYIQYLLDKGYAYYAFDTELEIENMRERLKTAKVTRQQYSSISREWMKNALTMPKEQVNEWIVAGKPYVIRLKIPHNKELVRFYDGVRGWVKIETSVLDDKILMKSDGVPTYHFANVVDDYLMKITHVIRGEEWLPSTPIHILLYHYLGWKDNMPQFVHLPLLLAPHGGGKLSKRHADQYGFPVFPISWNTTDFTITEGFREQGYLPEALLNFLAFLGWSSGTEQEVFTKQELIEKFSLKRLGKSGVKFDIAKVKWFNQQHIKKQGSVIWASYFIKDAKKSGVICNEQDAIAICELVKERITFTKDFWLEGRFFYFAPITYDNNLLQIKWNRQTKEVMLIFALKISSLLEWSHDTLRKFLQEAAIAQNLTMGNIMPILRMALTGLTSGPDLIKIMVLLGKDKTSERIATFLEKSSYSLLPSSV